MPLNSSNITYFNGKMSENDMDKFLVSLDDVFEESIKLRGSICFGLFSLEGYMNYVYMHKSPLIIL